MRNLSMEAAHMAMDNLKIQNPKLWDKKYRENLKPEEKEAIFNMLCILGEMYEMQLINELGWRYA